MKDTKKTARRWPAVVLAVLAVLIAAGVAWREPIRAIFYSNWDPQKPLDVSGAWAGGETYAGVQYSDVSASDYLNLYVPSSEVPPPLMVLVHGGGFVLNDCESRQAQLFYDYFRNHGYACATVNYRLAQEAKFPAAIRDVKAAVRFLRANADRYGYDASRVAIWGESAGGYLAVMAGMTTDEQFNDLPFIGEEALDAPVSAEVSAILDFYGVMELQTVQARKADFRALGIPGIVVDVAGRWLTDALKGTGIASVEDYWLDMDLDAITDEERQAFTPARYVAENLPNRADLRLSIWHGDADITVPWVQSQRLYAQAAGIAGEDRVSFELFRNMKHADEDMYSDENLARLKAWLEDAD